jgi:hypothetical protein
MNESEQNEAKSQFNAPKGSILSQNPTHHILNENVQKLKKN